jgi:hypothetical protein
VSPEFGSYYAGKKESVGTWLASTLMIWPKQGAFSLVWKNVARAAQTDTRPAKIKIFLQKNKKIWKNAMRDDAITSRCNLTQRR